MVRPKTPGQLALMRESGRISAMALKKVLASIKPGVNLLQLDQIAEDEIKRLGGQPAFINVPGYKWTSCITINEQVVHGIPTARKLQEGDVVGVDLGAVFQGWYSDAAWSTVVSQADQETKRFLQVGQEALWSGIKQAREGNTVGDISAAIQSVVEGAGYSVVRSLVGHGIGKSLHEEPQVPGFGQKKRGLSLQAGMSLAIEVIYTQGLPEVVLDADGWTISSADKSLGGLFEMTVIVGKKEAKILTDWRKV